MNSTRVKVLSYLNSNEHRPYTYFLASEVAHFYTLLLTGTDPSEGAGASVFVLSPSLSLQQRLVTSRFNL